METVAEKLYNALKKRIKRQTLIEDVCIFLAGVGVLGLLAYCLFY